MFDNKPLEYTYGSTTYRGYRHIDTFIVVSTYDAEEDISAKLDGGLYADGVNPHDLVLPFSIHVKPDYSAGMTCGITILDLPKCKDIREHGDEWLKECAQIYVKAWAQREAGLKRDELMQLEESEVEQWFINRLIDSWQANDKARNFIIANTMGEKA